MAIAAKNDYYVDATTTSIRSIDIRQLDELMNLSMAMVQESVTLRKKC